jgi:hypothetical protein
LFNKLQDSLFICPSAKTGSYVIPSTVVSIGASAFDYCSGLTGNLIIPASVKSIGSYAFYYCAGFTGDLTIPSSMTSIAEGTFYGCGGLTGTVTIPQTITTIGAHSFFQCNKLSSFQVDALNTKYSSLDNVLFTKMQDSLLICPATKTGSYVIPSSVKGIGNYAFYNCSSISGSLVIPKSVGLIGSYAFYGCTLLSGYEVDALNTRYLSNNGVLFNKNQDSLLVCPSGKIGSYSIPNTVKDIGTYAFYYCTGLTGSINIPASVLSIGNYAFYGCTQLTALQAHVSNKIFSSLDGVLFNKNQDSLFICPLGKVGKYTIPSTVTAIDFSAFDGCVGLTAVEIPASVTSIGSYAFEYCSGLSEISLPTKITTIGSGAFYACTNLQKISIQNPIPPTIEYYTFDLVNKALCQLLVPVGSLIDYQISNYWKEFSLISESSFAAVPTVSSNNILRIYKKDQFLMVDGTKYGELVEVFLLNGKQVYTLISTGNNLSISLPKSNMYLIKTNKKATKVLL